MNDSSIDDRIKQLLRDTLRQKVRIRYQSLNKSTTSDRHQAAEGFHHNTLPQSKIRRVSKARGRTKPLLLQREGAQDWLREATNKIRHHRFPFQNSRRSLITKPFPNPKFTRFPTLTQRESKKSIPLLGRHSRQIQRKSSAVVSHPAFTEYPKTRQAIRERERERERETHSRRLARTPAVLPMIPPPPPTPRK